MYRNKASVRCTIKFFAYPHKKEFLGHWEIPCPPRICISFSWLIQGLRCPVLTKKEEWENFTLVDFFTESALLSLLEVLAALGELRPLERMSSLIGEALPSGLAGCFLRPLRSVDIYLFNRNKSVSKSAFVQPFHLFLPHIRGMDGPLLLRAWKMKNQEYLTLLQFFLKAHLDFEVKGGKSFICLLKNIKCWLFYSVVSARNDNIRKMFQSCRCLHAKFSS